MTDQAKRDFRQFVRTHHPDRGGDPETFRAGLARYGRGAAAGRTLGVVEDDDPRLAAPIVVVRSEGLLRSALTGLRRRGRRQRPRRVR